MATNTNHQITARNKRIADKMVAQIEDRLAFLDCDDWHEIVGEIIQGLQAQKDGVR